MWVPHQIFLIGEPLIQLPDVKMSSNRLLSLSCRWKLINQARDKFWSQWKREYLSTLPLHRKWKLQKQNSKEGQLILLKDPASYVNWWRFARIERVHPGSDNIVRVEVAWTSEELVKRPSYQLPALPDAVDGGGLQKMESKDFNPRAWADHSVFTWLLNCFFYHSNIASKKMAYCL